MATLVSAVPALISGIVIGKQLTNISSAERPEQGVTQRMDQHITVRVRQYRLTVVNLDTTQHEPATLGEGMHVVAVPNPD